MAKRMKLWVVGALLLIIGGTVIASNMGFKFVPNDPGGNLFLTLSLPINNNYVKAHDLFNDLQASGTGCATVSSVVAFHIPGGGPTAGGKSRTSWTGGSVAADDFNITKGEGYGVAFSGGACTSAIIVGSHDPAFPYSFPNSPSQAFYLTSIPYHTTATKAHDLFNSIPSCAAVVAFHVPGGGPTVGGKSRTSWTGGSVAADDFSVVIGEAYGVQVSAPVASWIPAHY